MAWLSRKSLKEKGFLYLGENVLISDKASIYNAEEISIGDNSRIDDFCVISGKVKIGRNVHIAVYCNVAGGELGIEFGDFSGLAYKCNVFSQSDDYTGLALTNPTVPDEYKFETKNKVTIGRHCIVGANSVIFPGIHMREGSSLGAMSMLTKDTEEWGIYFGIPAKKIRNRKKDLLKFEEKYLLSLKQ